MSDQLEELKTKLADVTAQLINDPESVSEGQVLSALKMTAAVSMLSSRNPVGALSEINKMMGFHASDKIVAAEKNYLALTADEIELFRDKFNHEF